MRLCLLALVALLIPVPSLAAGPEGQQAAPDFLFSAPKGWLEVRGSWLFARARSDWYAFVTDQLTLEKSDFNGPTIAAEAGFTLTRRLSAVAGLDFGQARQASEYRDFVDNDRLPITQETHLRQVNISGNVQYALTDRGREVGRVAWVPRAFVPYIGAGGGVLWYQVRQNGDFVDFEDFSVFPDVFAAEGWAPSAQLFGGVDVRVYRRLYLTVDGRYLWAAGELGREWIGFEKLDLAGARFSAGVNVVF